MASDIRISSIRAEKTGRMSRITADVNGVPVWFESEDAELAPAPECFASCFLVAGLVRESRLSVDAPLSPAWRKGVSMLMKIFNEWWGLPVLDPAAAEAPPPAPERPAGTALLFSGGVDSFYSLLRGRYRPDTLLFVHGYDIPLDDTVRMNAYLKTYREVSAETGVPSVLIRTNLRKHPLIEPRLWMQVHGGALAGAGHLLSKRAGRLLMSATNPYSVSAPWGSHWRVDELWSSEKLHVTHTGADRTRNDKLREICGEPVVRRNLRVCLENLSDYGNCCSCEKCLRTMLVLRQQGVLESFSSVFDLSVPLEKRFRFVKVPIQTMEILIAGYEEILQRGLEPELDRAVRGFLGRYGTAKCTRKGRVRALLGPKVTRWLREKIYDA